MNKLKGIIKVLLIILMIVLINIPQVYADSPLDKMFNEADTFLNEADTNQTVNEEDILETSELIYNILVVIGIAVAFIGGLVIAIKFMTGAIEEKVEVKKDLMIYAFGCILLFLAPAIWKLVLKITEPFQ